MGGQAFNPEGISTPRMPPEIYYQVKERLLNILRQHFRYANSPLEAPAKTDHGDIDILVTVPVDPKAVRDPEYLKSMLGAKHWKRSRGSDTIAFTIPWPIDTDSQSDPASLKRPRSSSASSPPTPSQDKLDSATGLPIHSKADPDDSHRYIQLDLSLLPTHQTFSWLLFLHAHGDLWSVLGSILRRFGLTCTPSGFYLHIPEIEGQNKNLSRVKITDDPGTVLRYLGLEEERYWSVFASWDEMLGYACTSRFVDLGKGKRREEYERLEREEKAKLEEEQEKKDETLKAGSNVVKGEASASENDPNKGLIDQNVDQSHTSLDRSDGNDDARPPTPLVVDPPTDRKAFKDLENGGPALRSHDRAKASKRPLFAYFLTTYIDNNATIDTPPGSAAKMTKQEVVEDAKSWFAEETGEFERGFAERYERARKKGMSVVGVQGLWTGVRNMIKEEGGDGDVLGYGMKGVKGMVCGEAFEYLDIDTGENGADGRGDGESELELEALKAARRSYREMRYDLVLEWAQKFWRKAGERQKKIDMEISGKKLAAKVEQERLKALEDEEKRSP